MKIFRLAKRGSQIQPLAIAPYRMAALVKLLARPLGLEVTLLLVLVGKLVVGVATNDCSYRVVNSVRRAILAAFWRAGGGLVRCPKLLKTLLCCTEPGIFVAPAALAIAFVISMVGELQRRSIKQTRRG